MRLQHENMFSARSEAELDLAQVRAILLRVCKDQTGLTGPGLMGRGSKERGLMEHRLMKHGRIEQGPRPGQTDQLHLVDVPAVAGDSATGKLHNNGIAVAGDVLDPVAAGLFEETRGTKTFCP